MINDKVVYCEVVTYGMLDFFVKIEWEVVAIKFQFSEVAKQYEYLVATNIFSMQLR